MDNKVHTIVSNDEYQYSIQEAGTGCIAHCNVNKYNSKVAKELIEGLKEIVEIFEGEVATISPIGDKLHNKFVKKLGFEETNTTIHQDGKEWRVCVWAES